jgi:hypothetical protein
LQQRTSSGIKGSENRISVTIVPTSDAVFYTAKSSAGNGYLCRWDDIHANKKACVDLDDAGEVLSVK